MMLTITKATKLARARGKFPSPVALRFACANGNLPAQKIGKVWFIDRADFLSWLEGFPHKTGPKPAV